MSKSTATPATAAMVRAFYQDPVKGAARLAALKDAKCVLPGSRGRLSPEAIAGFNKGKPAARRYVTGATKRQAVVARGEMDNLRAQAAEAGLPVGTRGPLSKEAREALGLKVAKRKASASKK